MFEGETRVQVWLEATRHLLDSESELNLILDVASPGRETALGHDVTKLLNEMYAKESQFPVHTVSETIFPGWEYAHHGMAGVYETYAEEYALLKKRANRWGTYAHRMTHDTAEDGSPLNPLGVLINKMKRVQSGKLPNYRSVYELSVYKASSDANRLRNGPCLSHVSFKLDDGKVHLTALYRMHDYRYKVPGNLLGLARLQACVAREVGASLGKLVVHSTMAYLEQGSRKELRRIVEGALPTVK